MITFSVVYTHLMVFVMFLFDYRWQKNQCQYLHHCFIVNTMAVES